MIFTTRFSSRPLLILASALAGVASLSLLSAADAPSKIASSNQSLKNELTIAMSKGSAWLAKNQDSAGFWSTSDHPAITALALLGLQTQSLDTDEGKALSKGYDFLLSCVKEDGSIHNGKGLVNYNTSISLLALAAPAQKYEKEIISARRYLIGTQIDLGEKGKLDTPFDGGIGYGSKYEHSDMGNTLQALEALYYTRQFAQKDSPSSPQLNFQAAIHFLQNCQNLPEYNKQSWASDDPANKGGFIYYPGKSMAGETNLANGRVALRSYGSISYAGLLSYIYADLKRDDPRVQAVLDWLKNNYTLEENPGMGPQGLFYYYHTMAKALSVYGLDQLPTAKGNVPWREQLALRLLDLQKADGSWQNDNGRWMEKDPALVTSYALITLKLISLNL